ncbi:MAG: fibrillarin-like rRNA/tRNA 2'-O-methyltransferase [Candidatus Heimdallarchaeota archaeon]|nr:fibrillarin-like rRNA/tRNA 2'-O-methyltransferase [Candidatus Heimdallarchaeota archaeon]MCK4876114.1 fibrillarin-like rRNA/tRNA 2'-O-methyltransferase [Candidatus Heimdallarchaeota archaeon]
MSEIKQHEIENLFWVTLKDGNVRLATINLEPGNKVYTERLVTFHNVEYRTFDPFKSKLGAAIFQKMQAFPFSKNSKILYLGAASGTTISHISDIIGNEGFIYSVEFSPRSMRDLINVAERRKNIIPILADARFPEEYSMIVPMVDIIYEDVAQPSQADILNSNVQSYLKKGGYFFLAVKARSIDVTKDPKIIYNEVQNELQGYGLNILEVIDLEPYEKDHVMIVGQKQ